MNRAGMVAALVLVGLFAAALAAGCGTGAAQAQNYPARPVKIIVPTPPGGSVDVVGRITANYLQTALGQAFVIENRRCRQYDRLQGRRRGGARRSAIQSHFLAHSHLA